jgi:3-hydroxyisobutyrate dehydrogenase
VARVGVIGIGNMGLGIALRLLERGHQVAVRDLRPDLERIAAEAGARVLPTPRSIAASVDLVIVVVVSAAQIGEVLEGPDGLLAAAPTDVMVCSTVAPDDTRRFADAVRAHGAELLDAPISGGPVKARAGTMSLMLAATEAARQRHATVLADMASHRFLVSERAGDAARVKLLNNLLAGIHLAAGAAALAAGERMGLDPSTLQQVIAASSGQAWITDDRLPRALAGDYAPRAHAHILTKDLTLALQMLQAAGEDSPLGEAALAVFSAACAAGWAARDDAVLLEVARLSVPRASPGRPPPAPPPCA